MSGLPREFLLRATHTLATTHYYVDPASGSDAKDSPGTQANPLQTLAEVERRIPIGVDHVVFVHLRSGGGGYVWPQWRPRRLSAPLIFYADDTWDPAVYTTYASKTTTAGTTEAVLVDSVGGLTVNEFRGKWLQMTSGIASGHRKLVRDNTATDVIPASKFAAIPSAGDTYRIFTNAVSISLGTVPAGDNAIVLASSVGRDVTRGRETAPGAFVFVGINFTSLNRVGMSAPCVFYGCDFAQLNFDWSTAHPCYFGCDSATAVIEAVIPSAQLGASGILAWRGWGVNFSGTNAVFTTAGGELAGYWNTVGQLSDGESSSGTVRWVGGSGPRLLAFRPWMRWNIGFRADSTYVKLDGGGSESIVAQNGVWMDLGFADISPSAAAQEALLVSHGAIVKFGGSGIEPIGAASTGATVRVESSGKVLLQGTPTLGRAVDTDWEITGHGSPQNKAFFATAGDGIVHTDGSLILRES